MLEGTLYEFIPLVGGEIFDFVVDAAEESVTDGGGTRALGFNIWGSLIVAAVAGGSRSAWGSRGVSGTVGPCCFDRH